MKVISQDGMKITMFENGLWYIDDNSICLQTNKSNIYYTFAEYETNKKAKDIFETFMNHAMNEGCFDFRFYK